ncbi:Solute carrier family 35 member B1 [Hypsibius exemplaris]|uniref:Solute carrier family 35 member B1 n=1 Tax=Hypsibius exemplaris TaxID=2072580 RepID=A0A1W0WQN0_HYPEX|nr:Solute carrier family 35 member B1 [Hypsibius exemplaris]
MQRPCCAHAVDTAHTGGAVPHWRTPAHTGGAVRHVILEVHFGDFFKDSRNTWHSNSHPQRNLWCLDILPRLGERTSMARLENGGIGDGTQETGKSDVVRGALKSHASDAAFQTKSGAGESAAAVPKAKTERNHPVGSTPKLLFCAVGTFISFMVFGIFQERITRGIYGKSDRFTYTASMVFIQCVINAIFAKLVIHFTREPLDTTPRSMYGLCSLSYLGAMMSSNQALQYVSYPTQVLGKSCKPIPVMIFGVLFAHRRYSVRKYLFTLMIVLGVAVFFYENGKAHTKDEKKEIGFGEGLLLISLAMDGVTGTIQERMRHSHRTRPNAMMMWMNIFSSLVLLAVISVTGEIFEVMAFIRTYPYVIEHLLTFALCSAVGQYFIFLTVADFGPLPCSIITTTRKFFQILVSVFFFSNPMSSIGWFATVLVFLGLTLDTVFK